MGYAPLPDVELMGVPSFVPEEHPTGGEDLLDRVSILDSPIL